MAEQLEVSDKKSGAPSTMETVESEVAITEKQEPSADVFVAHTGRWEPPSAPEGLTRETFEDALDKVSRPLKGRFAHVPYSSDDLIRDKRTEVELEDR